MGTDVLSNSCEYISLQDPEQVCVHQGLGGDINVDINILSENCTKDQREK